MYDDNINSATSKMKLQLRVGIIYLKRNIKWLKFLGTTLTIRYFNYLKSY